MRKVVVLPQPDGPSSVTKAPSGTSRSMSSTATTVPPKRRVDVAEFDGIHSDQSSYSASGDSADRRATAASRRQDPPSVR